MRRGKISLSLSLRINKHNFKMIQIDDGVCNHSQILVMGISVDNLFDAKFLQQLMQCQVYTM